MQKAGSSILAAVPMWSAFMTQALPEVPNTTFTQPNPTTATKPVLTGQIVIDGQVHDILYYVDKNDPTGSDPTNPAIDPEYNNWEAGVENWATANRYGI
jgi:membrane carboxypeptidase/penicillin-binding protein